MKSKLYYFTEYIYTRLGPRTFTYFPDPPLDLEILLNKFNFTLVEDYVRPNDLFKKVYRLNHVKKYWFKKPQVLPTTTENLDEKLEKGLSKFYNLEKRIDNTLRIASDY